MFIDRIDAGRQLAAALIDLRDRSDQIVVLAIPRGGVIVGRELARSLHAPLEIILTRKLGAPNNPELAIGAVGGNYPCREFNLEELDWMTRQRSSWSQEQRFVRGVFAGGTFCYQSQQIFRDAGITVHSNTPLDSKNKLPDSNHSLRHTVVDLGADEFTLGRPHPMIDGTVRCQQFPRGVMSVAITSCARRPSRPRTEFRHDSCNMACIREGCAGPRRAQRLMIDDLRRTPAAACSHQHAKQTQFPSGPGDCPPPLDPPPRPRRK